MIEIELRASNRRTEPGSGKYLIINRQEKVTKLLDKVAYIIYTDDSSPIIFMEVFEQCMKYF